MKKIMYLTILLFCIFFNIKVVYSINDEFKCSGSLKECLINEGLSFNDLVNIEKIVFNNKTNNIITDFDNELDITNDILYNHVFGELPSISKIDNIFNGWYTSNDIKITSDSIFNYDNDITLYPSFNDISTMFKDVKKTDWYYNDIDEYAKEAMKWAVKNNILYGNKDGYLKPKDGATRAQVAAIIKRYMEN